MRNVPRRHFLSFQTSEKKKQGREFSFPVRLAFALLLLLACTWPTLSCSPLRADPKALREKNAPEDLAAIKAYAPVVETPLTLAGAVDYALKHNLQSRLAEMEKSLQEEAVTGRRTAMLPTLMAEAEATEKSRNVPSESINANTGAISLDPSISTDRNLNKGTATFTWNLLDFGVGYFRARQAGNQVVMAEQRIERARQKLILEVTRAFGQAVAARDAALMARKLLARFRERQDLAQEQVQDSLVSAATGLRSEIKYIEGLIQLSEFEARNQNAKATLAQLMGLPPTAQVVLAEVDPSILPTDMALDVDRMESEALHMRPELSEKDLEQLVSEDEARVALAQMFPSPAFFLRMEYDSNSYLTVHDWYTTGLRATWNLFSIPQQMSNRRVALLKADYLRQERLAVAVAVLAQLHIAWFNYRNALDQCLLKRNLHDKHARLVMELEKLKLVGDVNEDEYVQQMTQYFFARVQFMGSFSDLLTAREMVFNSLGRPSDQDRGLAAVHYLPPGDPAFPSLDEAMRQVLSQSREAAPLAAAPQMEPDRATPAPRPADPAPRPADPDMDAVRPALAAAPEPAPPGHAASPSALPASAVQPTPETGARPPEAAPPAPESLAMDERPVAPYAPEGPDQAPAPQAAQAPGPAPARPEPEPAQPPGPPMPDLLAMNATFTPISDLYSDRYEKLQIIYFQGPDFRGIKMASTARIPETLVSGSGPGRRLVLDIPGRWENRGAREVDLSSVNFGRVRLGSHPDKVRMVVDLMDQNARNPEVLRGQGQMVMFF